MSEKEEICEEEEVACPVCGGIRDDGYCQECWGEVISVLGELTGEKYKLDNCQRGTTGDLNIADYIIEKAEDLLEYAKDVKGSYESGRPLVG